MNNEPALIVTGVKSRFEVSVSLEFVFSVLVVSAVLGAVFEPFDEFAVLAPPEPHAKRTDNVSAKTGKTSKIC